jgi:hypothetical protein
MVSRGAGRSEIAVLAFLGRFLPKLGGVLGPRLFRFNLCIYSQILRRAWPKQESVSLGQYSEDFYLKMSFRDEA